MKTEPEVFSIETLAQKKKSLWDGVRNYQARNFMQSMKIGDEILFYHSSTDPSGIAGLARVSATAVPDPSQFDKKSEYYEPKATKEKPRWFCVEVEFVEKFQNFITLHMIKNSKECKNMLVIRPGQRLSVQPVSDEDFAFLTKWGRQKSKAEKASAKK